MIFDKAYVDFFHLAELGARLVQWVTRAKDNMKYRVVKNLTKGSETIIKDHLVKLTGKHKGMLVRRVEAWVEVDGELRKMVFITNNLKWSPRSVCDLYRRRWDIEVFFKQVKQTLKLSNFLGHSANAVRWQVYSALLVYVLLRFLAHHGPVPVGSAVVTTGGHLPHKGLIHAVGPSAGSENTEEKLTSAVTAALDLANERGWRSVAIPGISSGIFGVDARVCARSYVRGVLRHFSSQPGSTVAEVRLTLRLGAQGGDLVWAVELEMDWLAGVVAAAGDGPVDLRY